MTLAALLSTIAFVAVSVFISLWQKLGLEKDLLVGTVRSAVQLLAVGYLLHYVFQSDNPILVSLILATMVAVATWNAGKKGIGLRGIYIRIAISIAITEFVTIGFLLVMGIIPFTTQYIIPISGMTIGNSMVVCSLYLNRFVGEIHSKRDEIETLLTLGASPRQAFQDVLKRSTKASMIPTIDAMKTVGLVQLPGMMTGMIIAGASPMDAVRYQLLIVFAFASSAALTSIILSLSSYRLWFTKDEILKR
jgi:putative ABC transport system permease protein